MLEKGVPGSMSHDGFSKCPYCSLWVPTAFQMMHLASHPGYMAAFMGTSSAAPMPGGPTAAPVPGGPTALAPVSAPVVEASALVGAEAPLQSPAPPDRPGTLPHTPLPALDSAQTPPEPAPHTRGQGKAKAKAKAKPKAKRAEVPAGFGTLAGKGLTDVLIWIRARGEAGLLMDF